MDNSTKEERKVLAEQFVQQLNEWGIKNIKDIPEDTPLPKEHKEVWIIK